MTIRIASWNINSVRARMRSVERFLCEQSPDILCLQETKVACDLFPREAFRAMGYEYIFTRGQRMHYGVAIISRIPLMPLEQRDWQGNGEARHITAVLPSGVQLHNVYVPAGGDIADREVNPKFGQKIDFLQRMIDWGSLMKEPRILTGDFNIAPLASDVWNHKALLNVVSHTPMEIAMLARLQKSANWVDLGRHFIAPPKRLYTWWSYRAKDWAVSDRGRRLDHMWVTPDLLGASKAHQAYESCRGWEKPSDHIPLMTEFAFD